MYTPSTATLQVLTKMFVGYKKQKYIADNILPPMKDVPKRGKIFVGGNAHLKILGVKTPRELPAPVLDVRSSFKTFELGTFRRKIPVTQEEMDDWDLPLTPIKHATRAVAENLNVEREYALSSWMTTGTNFTNKATPSTKWNVAGGGDAAKKDINTAISTIGSATNIIGILSFNTWLGLRNEWQDSLVYAGQKDMLGLQAMANYVGIKAFYVGEAEYDAASDPNNPDMTRMWGSGNAWFLKVTDDPDGESEQCFGVSAKRDAVITTPKTDDPIGVKVIGDIKFADVVIDETKAYYFYTCLN